MPNWCNNSVTVYGPEDARIQFRKKLRLRIDFQRQAYKRAIAMTVSEVVEPSLSEFSLAKLKTMILENSPLCSETTVRTLTLLWNNYDKSLFEKNVEQITDLWKDFLTDFVAYDERDKGFLGFVSKLEEEPKIKEEEILDFSCFIPLKLGSSLLGFNSLSKDLLEDFLGSSLDHFNNGYHDNRSSWGTKWNANWGGLIDQHPELPEDSMEMRYWTAWSPATPVVQAMSEQFPSLIFDCKFDETGMAYCGREIYIGGECKYCGEAGTEIVEDEEQDTFEVVMPEWMNKAHTDLLGGV